MQDYRRNSSRIEQGHQEAIPLTTSECTDATLAIHNCGTSFAPRWAEYCREKGIPFKFVDCHENDIIRQLEPCRALLWHHSQSNPKDLLIARQVLSALEHSGFVIFPDFRTAWHFDDKVGQKYLFEALDIPTLGTYVFVERDSALEWAKSAEYPKVFKSRRGAGSSNVFLVRNAKHAQRLIRQAFGRGFSVYRPWENLKERAYKWRLGTSSILDLIKGGARFLYPPRFSRVLGRERGYAYFQDFAPDNDSDVRVIVIGEKAFGIRRWVRPDDFRASGSGRFSYDPELIDQDCIGLAFQAAKKIGSSCAAFDFVRKTDGSPAVLEISYGFIATVYDPCPGYWDVELNWHEGPFDPQGWIADLIMKQADKSVSR